MKIAQMNKVVRKAKRESGTIVQALSDRDDTITQLRALLRRVYDHDVFEHDDGCTWEAAGFEGDQDASCFACKIGLAADGKPTQ